MEQVAALCSRADFTPVSKGNVIPPTFLLIQRFFFAIGRYVEKVGESLSDSNHPAISVAKTREKTVERGTGGQKAAYPFSSEGPA
jgi:hypothetical protein